MMLTTTLLPETIATTPTTTTIPTTITTTELNNSSNSTTTTNSNNNSNSDEHEDLLAEMELIERLPTQERLKQAKRRRVLQLKKWSEYEKEYQNSFSSSGGLGVNNSSTNSFNLNLSSNSSSRKYSNNHSNHNHHSNNSHNYQTNSNNKFMNNRINKRSIKFQDHVILLDAIMRKDYDEVERLLKSGITPNSANEDGLTAIHQCCIDDSADLLRLLIRYGADVNVCDNDLWTPLHAAATCANLEICKILIENKAELLAVNTDGNMPYDICDDEICLEYIESEMAQRGVTQQAIDMKRSETEMRMLDDLKQIYLLSSSFSSFASIPLDGLNYNSLKNFTSYFENAITNDGCLNLNAKDNNGATLMHIACANGYTSVLQFLLNECQYAAENGACLVAPSILVTDNDGWTPLHVATFWGHQKAIEILLENGADINSMTNNDETVLELCDDMDIRDFIIQKNKEIENQQLQAAALAAIQKQLQLNNLINNNNNNENTNNGSKNGSIKRNSDSGGNLNNQNNNSTRSLKRTSTGVSRSSSVRRSSFRDKEKAARKLDTSFKEVLYANEVQEDALSSDYIDRPSNNNLINSNKQANESLTNPLQHQQQQINSNVKNYLKDDLENNNNNNNNSLNKKQTAVVKIINNTNTNSNPNLNTNNNHLNSNNKPMGIKSTTNSNNKSNNKENVHLVESSNSNGNQQANTSIGSQNDDDDDEDDDDSAVVANSGSTTPNTNNSKYSSHKQNTNLNVWVEIHTDGKPPIHSQPQSQQPPPPTIITTNASTTSNFSLLSSPLSNSSIPTVVSTVNNGSTTNQTLDSMNSGAFHLDNTKSSSSVAIIDVSNKRIISMKLPNKQDDYDYNDNDQDESATNKLHLTDSSENHHHHLNNNHIHSMSGGGLSMNSNSNLKSKEIIINQQQPTFLNSENQKKLF